MLLLESVLVVMAAVFIVVTTVRAMLVPIVTIVGMSCWTFCAHVPFVFARALGLGQGALDNFVEFASVEPYATAFWAVINLDTFAGSELKSCVIYRALHSIWYLLILCISYCTL